MGIKIRLDLIKSKNLEIIPVDYQETRIIGVYRPFKLVGNETPQSSCKNLITALKELEHGQRNVLYGGDFNINLNKECPESRLLQSFQDDLSLHQLVNKNTWFRVVETDGKPKLRKSKLDLIFTNLEDTKIIIDDLWTSDHKLIIANI